jgi:hypothetical protein
MIVFTVLGVISTAGRNLFIRLDSLHAFGMTKTVLKQHYV